MTALKEYSRLESVGVWRESPAAQRVDVAVAFGESTLVISSRADVALAHWSLAAVERVNPGESPAIFAPGPDAGETLEIEDATMVAAIEKVRTLIARRRPQAGRLRVLLLTGTLAAFVAFLVFWIPPAVLGHTVSVLPPATRDEIGVKLLTSIIRISGRPCSTPRGDAALVTLSQRLLGADGSRLLVMPDGVRQTAHLPGGFILLGKGLVEDHETPDVVAGHILAEELRRTASDPIERLLRSVGFMATVRLLTTGEIPAEKLARYAEDLLTAPPAPLPDADLLASFAEARVPSAPYAYALDISGESTLQLIEADPMWSGGAEPVLEDADWVSLQGICGE